MKKILSLALVLVLVLSLSTVAFADGEEGAEAAEATYTDVSTVTLIKEYKLTNAGTTSPAETFTFSELECTRVTDAAAGVTAENAPVPEIADVSYAAGEAGGANARKNITITLPQYNSVGIYTYTFTETDGGTAGVTYRSGAITLVVTVIEQNGKIRVAAVHTEGEGENKSGEFNNEYSAGSLSVSKEVTGLLGDTQKYFAITITLTGETGKDYTGNVITVGQTTYAENPTTVAVGSSATFYLKDGETINLGNIPYGVTYAVTEVDLEDYEETITDNDGGKIDAATQTVNVVNNKGGTVDTGITMDSMPYILLLAVVFMGLFVFFSKKRMMREN